MSDTTFFDAPQLVKETTDDYDEDFHYLFCIGKDGNDDIYAAMSGYVKDCDHRNIEYDDYSAVVYNDDEHVVCFDDERTLRQFDYCYITDERGNKFYFDIPQDMLDKLNAATVEAVKATECKKLRAELYDAYKEGYEDGTELGSDLSLKDDIDKDTDLESHTAMSFDEWLERAYPDEGYFVGHVDGEMAKFLCENDPLINLDYIELYQKSISPLFTLATEDLEMTEENPEEKVFEYADTGDFYGHMDEIISRSARPDLLSEMCDKYKIPAKTYEEFACKMAESGGISDYVYIIADITKETPEMYLEIDISLPNEVHSLSDIPLSAREQAFALKACNEAFKRETGKNLEDVCRVDKSLIKE